MKHEEPQIQVTEVLYVVTEYPTNWSVWHVAECTDEPNPCPDGLKFQDRQGAWWMPMVSFFATREQAVRFATQEPWEFNRHTVIGLPNR